MDACGMEAVGGELGQIVAQFSAWVKTLAGQIGRCRTHRRWNGWKPR
jgi:hypothetical protein